MLFQTLLQLNILICATPALAGWMLVPLGHVGAVRQAGVVWQMRAIETVPPKTEVLAETRRVQAVRLSPVLPARTAMPAPWAGPVAVIVPVPAPLLSSPHPFPHAARAP